MRRKRSQIDIFGRIKKIWIQHTRKWLERWLRSQSLEVYACEVIFTCKCRVTNQKKESAVRNLERIWLRKVGGEKEVIKGKTFFVVWWIHLQVVNIDVTWRIKIFFLKKRKKEERRKKKEERRKKKKTGCFLNEGNHSKRKGKERKGKETNCRVGKWWWVCPSPENF